MDEGTEGKQETASQIEMLTQALDAEKKRSADNLTRLKYAQADLENLKKRCDRQVEEAKKYGNEHIVVELLEVLDELEMAVKTGLSSNSTQALVEGVEMTLKKLRNVLADEGVSPIECMGQPFDPTKHNIVAKVEKKDAEGCTIVEEIRKGYTMKEKVIRPSIVKVVVKPSKSQEEMKPNE
jgi:molecular chaperone GrpE